LLPPLEFSNRHDCCLLLFEEDWIGRWPAGCPLLVLLICSLAPVSVEMGKGEKHGSGKIALKEPLRISVMPCRWRCDHFPHADLSFSIQNRAILRARVSHLPHWHMGVGV